MNETQTGVAEPRSTRLGSILSKGLDRLTAGLNGIGTLWIFALMVLINADVIGRAGFNAPLRGVPEIVSLSITGIVFLQLAHTLGHGRLTRADALIDWLRRRRPRLLEALLALHHLAGAAVFYLLLKASVPLLIKAWRFDDFVGAVGDFTAPVWPVKAIVVIGCAATLLQFVALSLRHARRALARPLRDGGAR